jgi:predicted secreted acid phosphatase
MSAVVNFSLDVTKLPKENFIVGKKGTYINLTLSVGDKTNDFGSNASVSIAQSQEEREAKVEKKYVGNGKVVWTDGSIVKAERKDAVVDAVVEEVETGDLPF